MTIVVTGASRGIGAGLVAAFQARGETVIGTTRDGAWPLDVSDQESQTVFAERLQGRAVDLLVCNAGVYLDKGDALEDGFAQPKWHASFATNVMGVFLTVQSLLPNLRAAPAAKIAVISSQMGSSERAKGSSYIYRASKAAVLNLGANLATDLRSEGIPVGIYHPGWVATDMGGKAAETTVDESVQGLMSRFAELALETTGTFQTWDGRKLPF